MTVYPTEGDIEIDGFLFYGKISSTTSYPFRTLKSTKIMNGGSVDTLTDWNPRQFKVTTYVTTGKNGREYYDKDFEKMQLKPCRIMCKEMGNSFLAYCKFTKNLIDGDLNGFGLDIEITELDSTMPMNNSSSMNKIRFNIQGD